MLGQEANFGLVTEAVFKIRPLAETTEYECLVFPSLDIGFNFAEAVVRSRRIPSSMRVLDEKQLTGAIALKE